MILFQVFSIQQDGLGLRYNEREQRAPQLAPLCQVPPMEDFLALGVIKPLTFPP